jgi:hypothetical protein
MHVGEGKGRGLNSGMLLREEGGAEQNPSLPPRQSMQLMWPRTTIMPLRDRYSRLRFVGSSNSNGFSMPWQDRLRCLRVGGRWVMRGSVLGATEKFPEDSMAKFKRGHSQEIFRHW